MLHLRAPSDLTEIQDEVLHSISHCFEKVFFLGFDVPKIGSY